jgi:hypothetical protein
MIRHSLLLLSAILFLANVGSSGEFRTVTKIPDETPIGPETPDSTLVTLLNSADGSIATKATAEAFRRGKALIPALEQAGARPMRTVSPTRIEVVYSLLKEDFPGDFRRDSFGLQLRGHPDRREIIRMGKAHGFILPDDEQIAEGASSSVCYVNLSSGQSLFKVIRSLLRSEPRVLVVNLNYIVQ